MMTPLLSVHSRIRMCNTKNLYNASCAYYTYAVPRRRSKSICSSVCWRSPSPPSPRVAGSGHGPPSPSVPQSASPMPPCRCQPASSVCSAAACSSLTGPQAVTGATTCLSTAQNVTGAHALSPQMIPQRVLATFRAANQCDFVWWWPMALCCLLAAAALLQTIAACNSLRRGELADFQNTRSLSHAIRSVLFLSLSTVSFIADCRLTETLEPLGPCIA